MPLRPYEYILFFKRTNYDTDNFFGYFFIDSVLNLTQTITLKVIPNLNQILAPKLNP